MRGQDDPAPAQVQAGPWRVWAQSVRGRVRRDNQDAWVAVLGATAAWGPDSGREPIADLPWRGGGAGLVAVFDGLGGHAHGRVASRAAARGVVAAAVGAEAPRDILKRLDDTVRATGGLTTAVVALVPAERQGHVVIVTAGDSTAYRADPESPGGIERVSRRHRAPDGRVTECLGTGTVQPDVQEWPADGRLLLVTDGVDSFVPPGHLGRLLSAPEDEVEQAIAELYEAVERAGAPDNATFVLLAPRSG